MGRARGLGRHRVLINLHAYQMLTNMIALLAHVGVRSSGQGMDENFERLDEVLVRLA